MSYRYTGMASVSITRDKWIIFEGHQKLSVPATVSFEPERALEVNEGSLTLSDAVVQELRKLNYQTARKAVIKQAQQA